MKKNHYHTFELKPLKDGSGFLAICRCGKFLKRQQDVKRLVMSSIPVRRYSA